MHAEDTARSAAAADPRLHRLCQQAGLAVAQVAGVQPVHDGQRDPYAVVGTGEIEGCEVVRYGRFGNNVLQLAHALQFARLSRLQWIKVTGFGGLFRPGSHVLRDGRVVHVGTSGASTGAALRGRYFFWWGLGGALRAVTGPSVAEAVRHDLSRVLTIGPLDRSDRVPTLHLHLRGGDVFGPQGQVNAAYVQPPLAYYTMAVLDWLGNHPGGRLAIVSQDRLNPVVDGLAAWAEKAQVDASVYCGSEAEDIGRLLSADTIVAGYGTFVPVIALMSSTIERVVFFNVRQQAAALAALSVQTDLIEDRCARYTGRGQWTHSPEQRELMLTYPSHCLHWSEGRPVRAPSPG